MAENTGLDLSYDEVETDIKIGFTVDGRVLEDVTVREIMLGESLLTPGLQTSVKVHSYLHNTPIKNFDVFKGAILGINLEKKILGRYGWPSSMDIAQTIYRIDNRTLRSPNTEEFTIRACDPSLLADAEALVSKSWKCTTPSEIVSHVLRSCAGVQRLEVEPSSPARDYIAENIHPFQVVAQQANYALAGADDPSFVHFMTYENLGTHKFQSLYNMTKQAPIMKYTYSDTNNTYPIQDAIMTYSFPCDFDLLSDILNGVNAQGKDVNSLTLFNPVLKSFSLVGSDVQGCGIGSGVIKAAISNHNSATQQDSCPDYAKVALLKRQARMGLLEKDKIALRLTVPFNIKLNAGKVIDVNLYNKEGRTSLDRNYGSGTYLILHMFHHISAGGYAITTMDCVATTVGRGEV